MNLTNTLTIKLMGIEKKENLIKQHKRMAMGKRISATGPTADKELGRRKGKK